MEKQAEAGVCFFAYNNTELDYVKFASIVSKYVKHNSKHSQVALITDEGTNNWLNQNFSQQEIDNLFDYVVISDVVHESNPRVHQDSPWTEFTAQFKNSNKHDVFRLTPFKKTLLIDVDFLMMNNFYDYIFETDISIGMHRTAEYIGSETPYHNEITLNSSGIQHWWSTVVYFDQSETSKLFFDTWEHVKDNWEYYGLLYQFPQHLFRTDFCVSIAAHMMNGFQNETFVHDFKTTPLLNMDQKDDIVKFNSINNVVLLKHNRREQWKNILVKHQETNLHIMNKRAFDRHIDSINELFEEAQNV